MRTSRSGSMKGLSLRAKVFFLFFGAALLIVVPALVLIARAVERGVYTNANSAIADASDKVTGSWEDGERALRFAVQFKATSPDVALSWSQGKTRALARALKEDLQDEVAIATDTAFAPLAGPHVERAVLEQALRAGTTLVVLPKGSPPLRLAAAWVRRDTSASRALRGDPLASPRPDSLLGVVAIARPLSAASLAPPRSRETRLALLVGDSLVSTTISDSLQPALRRWLRAPATEHPVSWQIGEEVYLPHELVLPSAGPAVRVVLLRRIGDEPGTVQAVKQSMIGIGIEALLMALILAAVVARIVARPT